MTQPLTTSASTPLEPVYYAFDPGPTLGWARFSSSGETEDIGQIPGLDAQAFWLETLTERYEVIVAIYERYIIDTRRYHHHGEEAETIQGIGIIKSWAYRHHLRLVGQEAKYYPTGLKWGGNIKVPTPHSKSHGTVAQGHGIFWLCEEGIRPHVLEL